MSHKTLWNLRQIKIQSTGETWGNLRTWEIQQKREYELTSVVYLRGEIIREKDLKHKRKFDHPEQLKKISRGIDQPDQLKETPWRVGQPEQLN